VHILGLGVNPDDDALEAALARQRDARRLRFEKIAGKLRELGMPIETAIETLPATTDEDALGRPRVARALIAAGHALSVEDAFNRYLSRGRPAYVPREGLGPREAIGAIRAAGGLASLAHYSEAPSQLPFLRELIDMGLNGLEVHYRAYDLETVRMMRAIATNLRLTWTGGTDYHGDRETYAEAHAQLWNPPEVEAGLRAALGSAAS
jgi:predicted metal-dependent phosphoesterase TrpH